MRLNRHLVIAGIAVGFALPLACGGSSNFSSGDGEAGEPNTGGSSAGTSGASSGGVAGTAAVGGTSGSSSGGAGGTTSGGSTSGGTSNGGTDSGGTDSGGAGGTASTGGTGGATGGGAGRGGSAGQGGVQTGGTGGQVGGSAGVGGMPDPRCPIRPPSGPCDANGIECRYDLARNCLCMTVVPPGYCSVWDARCDAMMGAIPPVDGGIGIPVSTSTCQCSAGTWACRYP